MGADKLIQGSGGESLTSARDDRDDPHILTTFVDDVTEVARSEQSDIGTIVANAGPDGLVPTMTLAGLLLVSPLSGVPLISTTLGLVIALCAIQAAFGRKSVWLPGFLTRRSVEGSRVHRAMGPVRRVAQWLEDRAIQRLSWLSEPPARTVFLVIATIYGLIMPLMEVMPFTSSLLGLATVFIGLGLLLRDGVLLLLALIPSAIVTVIVTQLLTM